MPPSSPRLRWLFALKLALSGGLLGWLLTRPAMQDFPTVLAGADWRWLVPAFASGGMAVLFCSLRWQLCLRAVGLHLPFWHIFRITLAGNAAGYFSIGTLGNDATRILLVCRREPNAALTTTSSLAMDHASSAPAMVLLLAAALAPMGLTPAFKRDAVPAIIIGSVVFVAIGLIIRWKWKALHNRIIEFLSLATTWKTIGWAALLSFPAWFAFAGAFYGVARALGQDLPPLSFAGICAVADAISSLPISIAGLGVREQAYQSLLALRHGVPVSVVVAISLGGFAIHLLWGAIGAVCLLAEPVGKDKLAN